MTTEETIVYLKYELSVTGRIKRNLLEPQQRERLDNVELALEEAITAVEQREKLAEKAVGLTVQNTELIELVNDLLKCAPKVAAESGQVILKNIIGESKC